MITPWRRIAPSVALVLGVLDIALIGVYGSTHLALVVVLFVLARLLGFAALDFLRNMIDYMIDRQS
jgi:Na+/H+-dicarboxylate symporter